MTSTEVAIPSPKISLSRLVDFNACDPQGKVAKVAEVQRQVLDNYSRGGDYWKPPRDGIVELHRTETPVDRLTDLVRWTRDDRWDNYNSAIEGYQQFIGQKKPEFVRVPDKKRYTHGALTVKLNPEVEIVWQRKPVILQMHFKKGLELTRRNVNPALYCMQEVYGQRVGIVDVHRGKLWLPTKSWRRYGLALRADAVAFVQIWNELLES